MTHGLLLIFSLLFFSRCTAPLSFTLPYRGEVRGGSFAWSLFFICFYSAIPDGSGFRCNTRNPEALESYDYFSSLAAPAAALSTVGPEIGTLFAAAFIFFHSLLH